MLSVTLFVTSKEVKMKIFFSFNIYIEIFTEYITDTQLCIHQHFLALSAEGLKVTTLQEPGAHSAPRAWFLIPFSNKAQCCMEIQLILKLRQRKYNMSLQYTKKLHYLEKIDILLETCHLTRLNLKEIQNLNRLLQVKRLIQ